MLSVQICITANKIFSIQLTLFLFLLVDGLLYRSIMCKGFLCGPGFVIKVFLAIISPVADPEGFMGVPIGILGQVWYLIVSIPDLCPLSYFHLNPLPAPFLNIL